MARSFNRRLARLLRVDDTVRNTVTSTFDSDQVVSIVGENASSGFDSDQVVAIIGENASGGGGTEIVSNNLLSVSPIAATNPAGLGGQVRNFGIYLGQNAGTSGANTDADYQIFMGEQAGYSYNTQQNSAASGMIGIGRYAGKTGGVESVYIGYLSGQHGGGTSKGYYNVAMGGYALNDDNGQGYNVAIGYGALQDVNTGRHNVAVGYKALNFGGNNTGAPIYNVAIGSEAGYKVTGNYNIFMGRQAGGSQSYDTTSANNIFIGWQSGYNNQAIRTGANNTFIGGSSGRNHTTGSSNTVIGYQALYNVNSGYSNTAAGLDAGKNLSTGYENVFIGKQAGEIITTGRANVVIGNGALSGTNATNGQTYNSIYIGYGSICSGYRNTEIVLGVGLTGKGNSTAYMGANSNYNPGNNSSWNTTSDSRIKTNITNYTTGLTILDQVDVKTYNYLSDSDIATAHPELADSDGSVHEGLDTTKTVVGIMAQDLETLLPDSVTTRENGIKTVNKDELFWVMLNSIKELKTLNEALTARVEVLENN